MLTRAAFLLSVISPATRVSYTQTIRRHIMTSAQSLPEWFESHINDIYGAHDEAARVAALDSFMAPTASVKHNEETLDAQEKRRRVLAQTAASSQTSVKWEGVEETSPVRNNLPLRRPYLS
jgi:hypothetical protein